jgi:hypothetical protein
MDNWVKLLGGCAGAALLLGCSATPAPPPKASAASPTVAPLPKVTAVPWPALTNCRELAAAVGTLPVADRAGLAAEAAPLALAARAGPHLVAPTAAVTPDLALPADDGTRRCVIIVESVPSVRAAPRRPVAHDMVRSTYRAGGAGRANPEYRRLQRQLRHLESPDRIGFVATGDPGLDLIGLVAGSVLQGIDAALDGHAAGALRARLAATPPTLAEAVWEPYAFDVTTIEAARSGIVRARLLDRATGTGWTLEEPMVERRLFRVANGRRARDRGLLDGGGSDLAAMADIAVWEQSGVRPSLTSLLTALGRIAGPGTTTVEADLAPLAPRQDLTDLVRAEIGSDGVRRFSLRDGSAASGLTADP